MYTLAIILLMLSNSHALSLDGKIKTKCVYNGILQLLPPSQCLSPCFLALCIFLYGDQMPGISPWKGLLKTFSGHNFPFILGRFPNYFNSIFSICSSMFSSANFLIPNSLSSHLSLDNRFEMPGSFAYSLHSFPYLIVL